MKHKILLGIAMPIFLSACGGYPGGGNLAQDIARNMLVQQCHTSINQQSLWQSAKLILGAEAQQWENRVCQCAAQEASQQMGMEHMMQLGSGQADQALINLTVQAAVNCYQRFAAQGFR
ncbi:MAG: hypothetical protein Q4D61_00500 [Cardiobacteriaceae bacterium]|nr:hypothetical protein [Cardiobacteriaceae bacterium]